MTKPIAIIVHAGTGILNCKKMTIEERQLLESGLKSVVFQGYKLLKAGESAVDAVASVVSLLEDLPDFNAGKGSALTTKEMVETEAAIMSGQEPRYAAVAGLRHIKNPVLLAKDLLLCPTSSGQLLISESAEEFAWQLGYPYTEQDYFFTGQRYAQLSELHDNPVDPVVFGVGAVALDQHGHVSVAVSDGGYPGKKFSCIDASSMYGVGLLADDQYMAASAFGTGRLLFQSKLAGNIAFRMRHFNENLENACHATFCDDFHAAGGKGSIIAIDRQGGLYHESNVSDVCLAGIDVNGRMLLNLDGCTSKTHQDQVLVN